MYFLNMNSDLILFIILTYQPKAAKDTRKDVSKTPVIDAHQAHLHQKDPRILIINEIKRNLKQNPLRSLNGVWKMRIGRPIALGMFQGMILRSS